MVPAILSLLDHRGNPNRFKAPMLQWLHNFNFYRSLRAHDPRGEVEEQNRCMDYYYSVRLPTAIFSMTGTLARVSQEGYVAIP